MWKLATLSLAVAAARFQPPEHPDFAIYDFHHVLRVQELDSVEKAPKAPKTTDSWASKFHLSHLMEYMNLAAFPKDMEDDYGSPKKLGQGSFGVTFKATRKATGEQVAIKFIISGFGSAYVSAQDYKKNAYVQQLVRASGEECQTLMAIHKGDSLDELGAGHVVKCLEDGITPEIEKVEQGESGSTKPLHIVMEFAGTDDVDKWWGKMLKAKLKPQEYVKKIKMMTKGMMAGLEFLGESKTDKQWVHHDLKPMNMVYNEKEDSVVVIDLGTAISSDKPEKKEACTPLFRAPEMGQFMIWPYVSWAPPIWSFDAFSAGVTVLGVASGPLSGQLNILPSLVQSHYAFAQVGLANLRTMKRVVAASSPKVEFEALLLEASADFYEERLSKVRATAPKSQARMAALAGLAACRFWMFRPLDPGQLLVQPSVPVPLSVPEHIWALLRDWMDSGFDEVLLKMLDPKPEKRPKPSEVLANEWFTREVNEVSVQPVEITCPEIPYSELGTNVVGCIVMMILLFACCCCGACPLGLAYGMKVIEAPVWKPLMVAGGTLTALSPLLFFYTLEWHILWILLLTPLGLLMTVTPMLPFKEEEQAKKIRLGIMSTAVALRCLRSLMVFITGLQVLPAGEVAPGYYAYILLEVAEIFFGGILLMCYGITLISLRRLTPLRQLEQSTELPTLSVSTAAPAVP